MTTRSTSEYPLFVTDGDIAKRMGVSSADLNKILPALSKEGFPESDPLMLDRRYWPACKIFLDRRYGIVAQSISSQPSVDGEEKW